MDQLGVNDDTFALPDVKEAVEGVLNAVAMFFGPKWRPTDHDITTIAKPAANIIGRNMRLKRIVKKTAAPAVLLGAIGAYIGSRTTNFAIVPQMRSGGGSVAQPPAPPSVPPQPPAQNFTPQAPPQQQPAQVQRTAANIPESKGFSAEAAAGMIDEIFAGTNL